jgi:hypothetical protein
MATTVLKTLTDTQLMANIVNTLSGNVSDEILGLRAFFGVEMIKRIEAAGFEDDKLARDTLFFSAGMSKAEISGWITDNFDLYYQSLITLVNLPEFESADLLGNDMPFLDLRKSLVIEYDYEDEGMSGIKNGVFPLDPYHADGAIPYRYGITASNDQGDVVELTGSMAIDDLDVEHITA